MEGDIRGLESRCTSLLYLYFDTIFFSMSIVLDFNIYIGPTKIMVSGYCVMCYTVTTSTLTPKH